MNLETARTFLFTPGDRPDRFGKAAASAADVVVLDLEDAVSPARKPEAREHIRAWLRDGNTAVVRINAAGTPWHDSDVAMAAETPAAVMVPKAEDPAGLAAIARRVPAVIPLVETAAGILGAPAICAAPSVVRPAFGSVDLGAQLGVDHRSHDALRHARSALVLAAAAAGCAGPIDGVTTALDDSAVLRADTEHAVLLGFTGKLCVHPRQIEVVHEALAPSAEDVEWARRVVAAAGDGSAVAAEGELVDRPVLLRAQAILARAER